MVPSLRKLSRFWALLLLAAVIATAGVVTDSTATVIGAMIVAPLMTPILGMVLSTVTMDPRNLGVSFLLVATGACAVIALGWLLGQLTPVPVVAATNSQVAARVDPTLGDLIAALATGAVGSFALVRDDVSDTLPGVAIAISLVPPLAVVGLTLESGAPKQALGALLLFLTNFGAILLTGLIVMAIYRVRSTAVQGLGPSTARRRRGRRIRYRAGRPAGPGLNADHLPTADQQQRDHCGEQLGQQGRLAGRERFKQRERGYSASDRAAAAP